MQRGRSSWAGFGVAVLAALAVLCPVRGWADEHITLTNGFEMDCARHELQAETGKVRLYSAGHGGTAGATTYLEVEANAIRAIEVIAGREAAPVVAVTRTSTTSTPGIREMLSEAGERHHIDTDLLLSLVNAESGGRATAVSRVGARGLMQLMPATAASLGVQDAFRPEQNIAGGTAYLDQLLTRFHDDIALALAAYNAGPGAVERWHGIPPYRETRAYVARILTEYNRRKKAALAVVVAR